MDDLGPSTRGLLPQLVEWSELDLDEYDRLGRDAVLALPTDEAIRAGVAWCKDTDPDVQGIGLDVLGWMSLDHHEALDPLIEAATLLHTSKHQIVRWSVATSLRVDGSNAGQTPLLLKLIQDDDENVRFQATVALIGTDEDDPHHEEVVQALMVAMHDPCEDTRDWATTALHLLEVDTPQVRMAFFRALDDDGADTAGEAAVGLASLGDARVLDRLMVELAKDDVGNLWVEAAARLADPRLLPLLLALKANGWQEDDEPRPEVLDEAIERCQEP